jgi:hypothetical protein
VEGNSREAQEREAVNLMRRNVFIWVMGTLAVGTSLIALWEASVGMAVLSFAGGAVAVGLLLPRWPIPRAIRLAGGIVPVALVAAGFFVAAHDGVRFGTALTASSDMLQEQPLYIWVRSIPATFFAFVMWGLPIGLRPSEASRRKPGFLTAAEVFLALTTYANVLLVERLFPNRVLEALFPSIRPPPYHFPFAVGFVLGGYLLNVLAQEKAVKRPREVWQEVVLIPVLLALAFLPLMSDFRGFGVEISIYIFVVAFLLLVRVILIRTARRGDWEEGTQPAQEPLGSPEAARYR